MIKNNVEKLHHVLAEVNQSMLRNEVLTPVMISYQWAAWLNRLETSETRVRINLWQKKKVAPFLHMVLVVYVTIPSRAVIIRNRAETTTWSWYAKVRTNTCPSRKGHWQWFPSPIKHIFVAIPWLLSTHSLLLPPFLNIRCSRSTKQMYVDIF
jgi:hypothetical protein